MSGALMPLGADGRHRRSGQPDSVELLTLRIDVAQLRRTVATVRAELEAAREASRSDLRLALLLPIVEQSIRLAAAPTEHDVFPRADGIQEIDLRPGRHTRVA
jgi:hypothetical protein